MLDIIRSDHLRSCPGSQDDQAKVRRLDQAGDDHVKSTEYILLMVQKSGDPPGMYKTRRK